MASDSLGRLGKERALALYRQMVVIRRCEERLASETAEIRA